MIVTSHSFTNDGNIPVKHTGFGKDKSPEFQISAGGKITSPITAILGHILAETQICGRFRLTLR